MNSLVTEVRNLYVPCKISPSIVLPRRDVIENVSQLAQRNKDHYWSRSDLMDDFGNQVLPVTVNYDTECPSCGCRSDDHLELGDSALGVDFLLMWNIWERPQK